VIRAAVLGSPISHSLSPLIHQTAYRALGIAAEYTSFDVTSDNLSAFLDEKLKDKWRGFSLTMPLKESVLDVVDSIEPIARRISSANTVVNIDGHWRASSTDILGFTNLFANLHVPRVAIIGGGGTARAAVGALVAHAAGAPGIDLFLRTPGRRGGLSQAASESAIAFKEMKGSWGSALSEYDLVVSTVPAGAISDDLARQVLPNGTLCEVLYHPWPTPLALRWQSAGLPIIDGIDLLVEQALDQIRIFTECDFDRAAMRKELLTVARQAQRTRM
jgi:shikimate dehydrogenase